MRHLLADRHGHRQAIAVLLFTLCFASITAFAFARWFRAIQLLYGDDTQRLTQLFNFAFSSSAWASAILVVLFGAYLWRLASQVRRAFASKP